LIEDLYTSGSFSFVLFFIVVLSRFLPRVLLYMEHQAKFSPNPSTMESPGSEVFDDNSLYSSSADSTSADSPEQTVPHMSTTKPASATMPSTSADEDDSASDISMPVETDDEDDATNSTAILVNPTGQSNGVEHTNRELSRKRKYSTSSETPNGQLESEAIQEDRKRHRPDGNLQIHESSVPLDKSLLPAEIWHHVFTFCPPRVLGLLLQVNKSFNACLDPSSSDRTVDSLPRSTVKLLSPDAIWTASRRLFHLPGMPAPLFGKSELDMWQMACGSLCQFCAKKKEINPAFAVDPWHPGPGENGVVPVWSFGIRTCGKCLLERSSKVGICFLIAFLLVRGLILDPGN
jgi:hypothetical protein